LVDIGQDWIEESKMCKSDKLMVSDLLEDTRFLWIWNPGGSKLTMGPQVCFAGADLLPLLILIQICESISKRNKHIQTYHSAEFL